MPSSLKVHSGETAPRGRGRPRDEVARSRILEAALEVLELHGFSNATCDAIAERAGASKATIYRWWPNKAAVLIEALREAVALELPFPDTGDVRKGHPGSVGKFHHAADRPARAHFQSVHRCRAK